MAEFSTTLTANGDTRPLYQVAVNDGGSDGGSTSYLLVGGFPPSPDSTPADAAVRALGEAFAEAAGYRVVSIKRLTVAETAVEASPAPGQVEPSTD